MRPRVTGLFLALILLGAAVPAVLACCLHGPQQHGGSNAAYSRQLPVVPGDAFRGCVDHAGPPTQSPYIETSSGGSGAAPASARGADAAPAPYPAQPAAAAHAARRSALHADSTGPPLWLSTCVSRT